MPAAIQAILDYIKEQWSLISQGWPSFLSGLVLIGAAEWLIVRAFNAREIRNLKGERDVALARLKQALEGNASTDQRLNAFEKQLAGLAIQVEQLAGLPALVESKASLADVQAQLANVRIQASEVRQANNAVASILLGPVTQEATGTVTGKGYVFEPAYVPEDEAKKSK